MLFRSVASCAGPGAVVKRLRRGAIELPADEQGEEWGAQGGVKRVLLHGVEGLLLTYVARRKTYQDLER